MGDVQEVQHAIEQKLAERSKKLVNRNALSALFGAYSDPLGSLGKIFLGRQDVIDAERDRLTQEAILSLLCNIDHAISEAGREMAEKGITLDGLIEVSADKADSVVGLDIASSATNVRLKPGTQIKAHAGEAGSVTGVRIGGE